MKTIYLSTGYEVQIQNDNLDQGIESYEHLIRAIVMEHFIKKRSKDPDFEDIIKITCNTIENEISYILENEIKDHSSFLKDVLLWMGIFQSFAGSGYSVNLGSERMRPGFHSWS